MFRHELRHCDGGQNLIDPLPAQYRVTPNINGPNVEVDNRINRQLGLPQRNSYRDQLDNLGRRYWSFQNGPVYLTPK
jgi:hypothetical protein